MLSYMLRVILLQFYDREFKLNKWHIVCSMSGAGCCYDNAVVESFSPTLKTEHTPFYRYQTGEQAMNSIFEYIEVFYQRLYSMLGYGSPNGIGKFMV